MELFVLLFRITLLNDTDRFPKKIMPPSFYFDKL